MHCVEETLAVPRRLAGPQLLDAALGYTQERHWEVMPGAWLDVGPEGASRCSCASAACPSPGAHPTRPDWAGLATGSAMLVRREWQKHPRASVLLPTGRTFDGIEVSESAGFHALARMERMGVPVGPVSTAARRMVFFVLPGAAAKVPAQLRGLGTPPESLDLVMRGDGDWIVAPPTRTGSGGCAQWARRPTEVNRWLPEAAELLSVLAYVCGREAAQARAKH